jgi:2-methylisocitrate lyase-like PEP mutase family enzyme
MPDNVLRQMIDRRQFFLAPGIHDMMSAVIARDLGFEIVYGSGFWFSASAFGLPDAGITTYTQMLDRMATLKRTSGAVVIADADTGYGGLLNVHHTVRGYEDAGISGIQIEDQEFPKKCGHTPYKRLISTAAMVEKVRVAVDARRDARNTLIIARTDARQSEGLDGAMKRMAAYQEAGADILFVEALQSEAEMRTACRAFSKPMMANMADGGKTPIRSAAELTDIGYAGAIFPASTALAANAAVAGVLTSLKNHGTSQSPNVPLYDFDKFCRQIGFEEVWAFEKKWGARDEPQD